MASHNVPEDRTGVGSAPGLSLSDNLIMKNYRQAPVSSGPSAQPASAGVSAIVAAQPAARRGQPWRNECMRKIVRSGARRNLKFATASPKVR